MICEKFVQFYYLCVLNTKLMSTSTGTRVSHVCYRIASALPIKALARTYDEAEFKSF